MINVAVPGYLHANILPERHRKTARQGKINGKKYPLRSDRYRILRPPLRLWEKPSLPGIILPLLDAVLLAPYTDALTA
jgi:hypothetical protein